LFVALVGWPALADHPGVPVVVHEDFEDGVADGFFTGTGGLFNPGAQLGTIVDDGIGNQVYELQEAESSQAFVSPDVVADFDLKFKATSLPGPFEPDPAGRGMVGVLFRADPNGVDGYFLDSQTLFVTSDDGAGGIDFNELASFEGPGPTPGDHKMRVRVVGDRIKVFRDGKLIISTTDSTYSQGNVGLVEVNGGTVHVDDIVLRRIPRPS
jgi:hypothetical protein